MMAVQESSVLKVKCDKDFTSDFISNLTTLRTDGSFFDFTIRVDDVTIPCHRLVLAATCRYFRALFSSGLTEATQGEVTLDDLDAEVMRNIVDYMYSGNIDIQRSNVKDVLEACEFLQLEHLKVHCENYIVENLSHDNCLEWFLFGDCFTQMVKQQALHLITQNFVRLSKSEDFKNLSKSELNILLLANPATEMYHIRAVIEWIMYDRDNRREHFEDLLSATGGLSLCPGGYLEYVKATYSDLFSSNTRKLLPKTLSRPMNKSKEKIIAVPKTNDDEEYENYMCWALSSSEAVFEPL